MNENKIEIFINFDFIISKNNYDKALLI